MGKGSKEFVIGYRYYMSVHIAICDGPIDWINWVFVDERQVWPGVEGLKGTWRSGSINISKEYLFGGEEKEGGISGEVQLWPGESTQTPTGKLVQYYGGSTLTPGFRGVTTVLLNRVYHGTSVYLKPWSFRPTRIFKTWDGSTQWYDSKAPIGDLFSEPTSLYLALDTSASMNTVVTLPSTTRLDNAKIAINYVIDQAITAIQTFGTPIDIMVVAWDGSRNVLSYRNATVSQLTTLKTWVTARGTMIAQTWFYQGVVEAEAWWAGTSNNKRKVMAFITDGYPYHPGQTQLEIAQEAYDTLFTTTDFLSYGVNIDLSDITYTLYCDNTPEDSVPVIPGDDPSALSNIIFVGVSGHLDLNPAHLLREIHVAESWGMGYTSADVDDTQWMTAADTLFDEQLGISINWKNQTSIERLRDDVLAHISGIIYVDRTTGKFVLKLIRDDYVVSDLLVLDSSNVISVTDYGAPAVGELVNQVTVRYWDQARRKTGSVAVSDPALAEIQGAVINRTIDYNGLSNFENAAKVAARELRVMSTPLIPATITANREASQLQKGDVFVLERPDLGIDSLVMRVFEIDLGDPSNNKIVIKATQDVFSTPSTSFVTLPVNQWVNPISNDPVPATVRFLMEVPYYVLVVWETQSEADDLLLAEPDLGFLSFSCGKPNASANFYNALIDAGSGYGSRVRGDFSPFAVLESNLDYLDTTIITSTYTDIDPALGLVELPTLALINDEIVEITAIVFDSSDVATLTINKGVLDTVPAKHVIGDALILWGDTLQTDAVEYVTTESLDVIMLPVIGTAELPEADATIDTIVMANRAIRPYPPGNVQLESLRYPEDQVFIGPLELTWSHRDRLQQTGGIIDQLQGDIGPESSTVTYIIRLYDSTDTLVEEITGILDTSEIIFPPGSASTDDPAIYNNYAYIELCSERDGYESWQCHKFRIYWQDEFYPFGSGSSSSSSSNLPSLGDRGLSYGGVEGSSTVINDIDYITISTPGNSTSFGSITSNVLQNASVASSLDRAVLCGGFNGSLPVNNVQYNTIASPGNTTNFGSLASFAQHSQAGCSDLTYGLYGAGFSTSTPNNTIDYVTIATTSDTSDFGDLTQTLRVTGSCADETRGIWGGGRDNVGNPVNVIQYVTIASPGNATDFGDMNVTTAYVGGAADGVDRGLLSSGYDLSVYTDFIDYFAFSTPSNATDFGNLTQQRKFAGGCSNGIRAVWMTGDEGSSSRYNVMDYVTIATPGNATDFGDMATSRSATCGCQGNG